MLKLLSSGLVMALSFLQVTAYADLIPLDQPQIEETTTVPSKVQNEWTQHKEAMVEARNEGPDTESVVVTAPSPATSDPSAGPSTTDAADGPTTTDRGNSGDTILNSTAVTSPMPAAESSTTVVPAPADADADTGTNADYEEWTQTSAGPDNPQEPNPPPISPIEQWQQQQWESLLFTEYVRFPPSLEDQSGRYRVQRRDSQGRPIEFISPDPFGYLRYTVTYDDAGRINRVYRNLDRGFREDTWVYRLSYIGHHQLVVTETRCVAPLGAVITSTHIRKYDVTDTGLTETLAVDFYYGNENRLGSATLSAIRILDRRSASSRLFVISPYFHGPLDFLSDPQNFYFFEYSDYGAPEPSTPLPARVMTADEIHQFLQSFGVGAELHTFPIETADTGLGEE